MVLTLIAVMIINNTDYRSIFIIDNKYWAINQQWSSTMGTNINKIDW